MSKLLYVLAAIAIFVAFYQMKTDAPNPIVTSICVVVFMVVMMRLSSKTRSKNDPNDEREN